MKLALVAIAKDEDKYLKEWIDHYKKLGFDQIYLYENNYRSNINDSSMLKIPCDGECKQGYAYNHFIQNHSSSYNWAAFFDIDEFLVLKKHSNIKDFIYEYGFDAHSLAINWIFFGNNFIEDYDPSNNSLINRFKMRQKKVNEHIKSIIKLEPNISMINPHHANVQWKDTNGNFGTGPFNHNGTDDVVQLNHYVCKTKHEYMEKVMRGRADVPVSRSIEEFEGMNYNEIEDLFLFNKNQKSS
jgi:hypothetical protein